jgi:hypothetical protein
MPNVIETLEAFRRKNAITDAANYWANDNSRFEQGNPTTLDRALRSLNPLTSLGSAMGAMQSGASQGSGRDMMIALAQALPSFGVGKLAHLPAAINTIGPTLKALGTHTGGSVAVDETQSLEQLMKSLGN